MHFASSYPMIYLHPFCEQKPIVDYCKENDIVRKMELKVLCQCLFWFRAKF